MSPRISIVMSVYNGEPYLDKAIESILNQTFTDFELILVDDGSMDNSLPILRKYAQEDMRIKIIENSHNIGLAASLNKGVDAAQGEFIARMDADDISLSHRLEAQIKFMDEHPEIDVLGTAFTLIDESGNPLRSVVFSSHPDVLRWNLLFFNPIAHPSALMRSSTIRKMGGYDIQLTSAQDYELWSRVILAGRLSNLEESHMLLRLHDKRITYKHRDQQLAFISEAKQKYLKAVLHKDIPNETTRDLNDKPITARRAAMVAALILEYCNYCTKNVPASVAVQIMISALEKGARKIGRFIIDPATWGIGIRFCSLMLKLAVTWLGIAKTGIQRRFLFNKETACRKRFLM